MSDKENGVDEIKPDQNEEVEGFNEVETKLSEELRANLNKLEEEFRATFSERMATFATQCEVQKTQEIDEKKKEVLTINKIFRDISRPLGAKWKMLFERLLIGLPSDQIQSEIAKVEREKSFVQAYKALSAWKELKGEQFDMQQLVEALQDCGLSDLAMNVSRALSGDSGDLFSLSGAAPGRAGPGGSAAAPSSSESAAAAAAAARERLAAARAADASNSSTAVQNDSANVSVPAAASTPRPTPGVEKFTLSESLDDRRILQLAKKIAGDWEALGKALGVGEQELKEIMDSEGKCYQGAFKLLWNWRDGIDQFKQESVDKLKFALAKCNRSDLAMMYP